MVADLKFIKFAYQAQFPGAQLPLVPEPTLNNAYARTQNRAEDAVNYIVRKFTGPKQTYAPK